MIKAQIEYINGRGPDEFDCYSYDYDKTTACWNFRLDQGRLHVPIHSVQKVMVKEIINEMTGPRGPKGS